MRLTFYGHSCFLVEAGEKRFVFDPKGRRDPFTFRRKPDPDVITGVNPAEPGPPGGGVEPTTVELMVLKEKSEKLYGEAEESFMNLNKDGRAVEVVLKCDKGLEVFKDVANIAKYTMLLEVREKLLDLRKAAERIRQRQEAEKKFKELNIRVTGVVVRDRRSQAIISGRGGPASRGTVVAASESYDATVDDIRDDQVIFLFQGYRMALQLSEMPK